MRTTNSLLSLCASMLLIIACKKTQNEIAAVPNADFTASKTISYSHSEITFKASDSTSKLLYEFNFGDGTSATGNFKAAHTYMRGGAFNVTMTVGGKSTSQTIQIRPGVLSYQIKNVSSKTLDIMSYVDQYINGSMFRKEYYPNTISDSLWLASPQAWGINGNNSLHLLGMSVYLGNNEYVLENPIWVKDRENYILQVGDSTMVIPRTSFGSWPSPRYIKDL